MLLQREHFSALSINFPLMFPHICHIVGKFKVAKQSGRDWFLYKPLFCYQGILNELILACVSSYPVEKMLLCLPEWKLGAV